MTVKIDGVEPNIFPDVHDLDARDAGRLGTLPPGDRDAVRIYLRQRLSGLD